MAGIMRLETPGASVRCDETLRGRQFDVTVRRPLSDTLELTLVECRDRKHKVLAEHVDSVVTKGADAGASRVVIVAQRGFSRGAIEVARRHRIELYLITERIEELKPRVVEEPGEAINIRHVRFFGAQRVPFEERPDAEDNLLLATTIGLPDGRRQPFRSFLDRYQPAILPTLRAKDGPETFTFEFPHGVSVRFPESEDQPTTAMQFEAKLLSTVVRRLIDRPVNLAEIRSFEWRRIDAPASHTYNALEVPMGDDTFRIGTFYRSALGTRSACLAVEQETATLRFLEPEHSLSLDLRVPIETAPYYVPIENLDEIAHLQALCARQDASAPTLIRPETIGPDGLG